MAGEAQERTEQATEKHLKEARKKGHLQKSRDLVAWTSVAAGVVMLPTTLHSAYTDLGAQVASVGDVVADPSLAAVRSSLYDGLGTLGHIMLPMLLAVGVTAVAAGVVQGGVHLRRLAPMPGQFNLVKGLGRIVGPRAAWEAAKTLVKALAVGLGFALVIRAWLPTLLQTGGMPLGGLVQAGSSSAAMMLLVVVGAGLAFAGLDLMVVLRRNRASTRMTKREVKDELKNTDGDPLVRSHRRSMQLAMSRNRMIAAVGHANVVIVNPTHVAVALAYQPGQQAPRLVAKGADFIAARIREEARQKQVPIVEDIPLARALYGACEVGAQIPVEFFVPVANVLAFLMLVKRRGASLGDVLTVPAQPAATGRHRQGGAATQPAPVRAATAAATPSKETGVSV
ncbi:MAG TPA: EscU/YscU/HrcU family type III secretion system export apparatus switch protein [Microbacteriaceae bacterium]|nr:EscU/YscU/HrcU family type III secretion system export apparatus switch protein [Microbacteriaceae bacterium]